MKRMILIVGLCAGAISGYCETPHISCDGLDRNLFGQGPKLIVVDVRTAADYRRSHIPGAVNAAYDVIEKAKLPKDGGIVLYGNNNQCPWSKLAAKTLENAGYKNVRVLDGGIEEWTAEKFALQTAAGVMRPDGKLAVVTVSPDRLREQMKKGPVAVLDTRGAKEFAIGHLPAARNIPLESIDAAAGTLSKDAEWVVCDKDAARAKEAVRALAGKGFSAKELSGGIQVWAAKKYPLETEQAK